MVGSESRILDIFATIFSLKALKPSQVTALSHVSEESARLLMRAVYREFKNNPGAQEGLQELFIRVESGDRAFTYWVDQILIVYNWLQGQGRVARFSDVVEYVSCSLQGASSQPGHSLAWYLEQYGFEKSAPL